MKVLIGCALIVLILSGCGTVKYTLNRTFMTQREFGPNSLEEGHPDILLANADDWVRRNLW